MDSDVSPVVNLEVTVPVLPTGLHRHGPMQVSATSQYSESIESEEVEQVRLVPIGLRKDLSLHQPREQAIDDVPERMIHSIRFRVFHLTVPAPGQPFLLQVLRRYNEYIGKKRRKRMPAFLTHWHVLIETAKRSRDAGNDLGSLIIDASALRRRAQEWITPPETPPAGAVWDTGPLPGINFIFPGSDISAMAYLGA